MKQPSTTLKLYEHVIDLHAQDCPNCWQFGTVKRVAVYTHNVNRGVVYEYRRCRVCGCIVYPNGNVWRDAA